MADAWDPDIYRASSANQQRWGQALLARLRLQGHETVLDIGCGDGRLTVRLARRVPRGYVVGVDRAPAMIRAARAAFSRRMYPNVHFLIMDARALGFRATFDVVFSNAALHWVRDHRSVLRGIRASLKPGGRALLQMGGEGNAAPVVQVLEALRQTPRWAPYFRDFVFPYGFYGPRVYRAWLLEAGLQPQRVVLLPKDMVHEDAHMFALWLRATWHPYTRRVPRAMRAAFIQEAVHQYLKRVPPDAQGRVHVPMVRLEVEAIRP